MRVAILVVAALVAWVPADAHALGCCVGSPALTDRVALWETFVASFAASGDGVFARQSGGAFTGAGGTDAAANGQLTLLYRFNPAWSTWATLPATLAMRDLSGLHGLGGGYGDTDVGVRFEDDALGGWSFGARLTLPSGRATGQSTAPLAVDVTGRGLAVAKVGGWGDWTDANGFFATWVGWVGAGLPAVPTPISAEFTLDSALVFGRYFPGSHSLAVALRESAAASTGPYGAGFRHRTGLIVSGALSLGGPFTLVGSVFGDVHAIEDAMHAGVSIGLRIAP